MKKNLILGFVLLFLSSAPAFAQRTTIIATDRGNVNNPLSLFQAENYKAKSSGVKLEASEPGGQHLASIRNGDYAMFERFDFDSGVAAIRILIATPRQGSLEVRLDSPDGPLMGVVPFKSTGGWSSWQDVSKNVDHSLAGVRDVYLVAKGARGNALVNIKNFVFLKSTVNEGQRVDLATRVDVVDGEPQAANAWGMPEAGFTDDFERGAGNWLGEGFSLAGGAVAGRQSLGFLGEKGGFAYTPNVYVNKTDTGGEWRTLAQASLYATLVIDEKTARPGIGFVSKDTRQSVSIVFNPENNTIEARRKLLDGESVIHVHPRKNYPQKTPLALEVGKTYQIRLDWSPFSNALILFVKDADGNAVTDFRTVIDLPAARRPLLFCSGGKARFDDVRFDPNLDGWNLKWQWKKTPVLTDDVCNPAVWPGQDGKIYMMWRKFGGDTFHGVAVSSDGVEWTRLNDELLKCRGDMNVLDDPLGDGLLYITPGSQNMSWYTSDGSKQYTEWKESGKTLGNIFNNNRIQEFIDTKKHPQLRPVKFQGKEYRFIGFCENWEKEPKPHTVVLLSNTLTDWVLADPQPLLPPGSDFWGEKGNAIGAAHVLPDGNILLASCSCTHDGYTGASEPSNVSLIVDGREPWKVLKVGTLPDAPVSREAVWYQGPNFGTAYHYDPKTDTLFFYGGFHDYHIGVMKVENFMRSEAAKMTKKTAR